jgi:hypothetical protein
MASGRLLIIVPELDLRLSLEFLLEAEGYAVTSRPGLDLALVRQQGPFSCAVVDHKAVVGPRDRVAEFCRMAGPIVLLGDHPVPALDHYVVETVSKLVAGRDLPAAIARTIAAGVPQGH